GRAGCAGGTREGPDARELRAGAVAGTAPRLGSGSAVPRSRAPVDGAASWASLRLLSRAAPAAQRRRSLTVHAYRFHLCTQAMDGQPRYLGRDAERRAAGIVRTYGRRRGSVRADGAALSRGD